MRAVAAVPMLRVLVMMMGVFDGAQLFHLDEAHGLAKAVDDGGKRP